MLSDAWPRNHLADVQTFYANSTAAGSQFVPWRRRPGVTMLQIFCLGGGGGGGNGVVGANSTAGGGGGGGSANQMSVTIPAILLPPELFISVGLGGAANTAGMPSRVGILADVSPSSCVALANGGGAGGNAAAGAGGSLGAAATNVTAANVILGASFFTTTNAQAGVAGSNASVGNSVTMPTTGLLCMGGPGGGGLPAAAAVGVNGGGYTGTGDWTAPPVGLGGTTATTPATNGCNGYSPVPDLFFFFGGTGGGTSHGSATGAGLVGGNGGQGGFGSGGGGGGGALTGSTQGLGGRGGDGIVIIASW